MMTLVAAGFQTLLVEVAGVFAGAIALYAYWKTMTKEK